MADKFCLLQTNPATVLRWRYHVAADDQWRGQDKADTWGLQPNAPMVDTPSWTVWLSARTITQSSRFFGTLHGKALQALMLNQQIQQLTHAR